MKAAVYKGNQKLSVEEVPTPTPGDDEVLIRVKLCAICGTDVHAVLYDVAPPGAVLGHEYVGTIEAVGRDVTRLKSGDRVMGGGGTPPPGMASRLRTHPRYSFRTEGLTGPMGAYAEYIVNKMWTPTLVPDDVSDEAAALCEPCGTAVHAVRLSGMRVGDVVAVLGAGPIGFFCAQVAKAAGAGTVIVSEPVASRSEAVLAAGADIAVDPTTQDLVEAVEDASEGLGADVVFDCAGVKPTLDQAMSAVTRGGSVVLVAVPWEEIPLAPVDWMAREVTLKTSFGSLPRDWAITVDLVQSGDVVVEPMLSPEQFVPLDEIQRAFEGLFKPSTELQMMVQV